MGMKWSPEQELAINEEGKNIIVSAGAGSGKTAVLTARVIRKLQSGIHINELLVLTFTNAAAAEMKERIRKNIKKTKGLEEEENLIDGAYITTFDSFSLSVVKKYHTRLNITNKIAITDEVVIELAKNNILDEIFNKYYDSNNNKFISLINDFCLKKDDELKQYIKNIYKKLELKYDIEDYLDNFFNIYYTEEIINNYIEEYTNILLENIKEIKKLLIEMNDYFENDFMIKMEDSFKNLLKAKTYKDILNSIEFKIPISPKNSDPRGKVLKENISKLRKEIKELCTYSSTLEMKEEILKTKDNAEIIMDIIKELNNKLTLYKRENEIFSFNDIARLAIKVVKENDDIKNELMNSFNEILVDEYQDTSDIQETFINLIANNNVYMVGDIKQSIYRFRNANPYIFKNKYDTYRDDNTKGMKIDLLKNFRSRREVLDNINKLFELFMDDYLGGADYKASHKMIFGNTTYEEQGKTDINYNLEIIKYLESTNRNISKDEQEAFIIAEDIKYKFDTGYKVFDKDEQILRKVNYNDFVILLDRSKNFDLYKQIFEYMGIPLTVLKEESLSKDDDIFVIKNLLKLIIFIKEKNYTTDFKYSFTSIARSFLYRLDDNEIFNYFINNNFKESIIYKDLYELTKYINNNSPEIFFNIVIDKVNYEEKLITIGKVKSYRTRLEYIYNLISDLGSKGYTIYDFVNYLDEIFSLDLDLKFNTNTSSSNSVKIMTIHKSKGLEYHYCYFAGFTGEFNTMELKEKILYDNKYGLIISNVDEYYKDNIIKILLKKSVKQEEISEKIRLLYVAVTRAKEKMIIVIPDKDEEKDIINGIVPNYIRSKYNSFYDIIKSILGNLIEFEKEISPEVSKDYLKSKNDKKEPEKEKTNLLVKEINIESNIIEESHFSKDIPHLSTKEEKEVMEFGTKVHEILEVIDFKDYNLDDFNINDNIKDKINNFINSKLIQDNINNNMYKEYEFIKNDGSNKLHGIIDLLIEKENEMIIIDYKLKKIDDKNYDKQLNGYKEFIEKKTKKKTICYLYSIIDEKIRKID